ncbi:MAG: type IV toxin-antitoxin system AbiEi family antitoxin domain-containing protein [Acidobacteria bacterium]|nr:type IV toxin-antitoxin system AbiEi family antitoxin domain-containing protein [Acidobacteriota bacterium]
MDAGIEELAMRQHGLVTWAQARASGLSGSAISRRVAAGRWHRIRPRVYVFAGVPSTYEQTVLAAVLFADERFGWASQRTAARLHRLEVPGPPEIDVLTLPTKRIDAPGIRHHRSAEIRLADLGRVDGIPVTAIPRTLVDCLPWLGETGFGRALDDARRRRLITAEEAEGAHAHLDRGRRTGRHLIVPGRKPLALRVAGQLAGGSDRELDVLAVLASAGLPLPVQQHRVVIGRRGRLLDFAYPEMQVGIEWDGFETHGLMRDVFDDDRIRDAELQLLGWLMLHPTSRTPPDLLAGWVRSALAARSA